MVKKETQSKDKIILKVDARTITGKKTSELRLQGILPAVVYGAELKPLNIQLNRKDFLHVYGEAGDSGLIELLLGDKKINVLVHEVSHTGADSQDPIHVDFYQVNLNKTVTAEVPLSFVGESQAIKDGGVLVKSIESVEVEALPQDLPHEIVVDLSALKTFDTTLYIKDLIVPVNVTIAINSDNPVVTVSAPITDEELKAMEEENKVNVSDIKTEKEEKVGEVVPEEGTPTEAKSGEKPAPDKK
jgi:large subunit ribosomal protein L25